MLGDKCRSQDMVGRLLAIIHDRDGSMNPSRNDRGETWLTSFFAGGGMLILLSIYLLADWFLLGHSCFTMLSASALQQYMVNFWLWFEGTFGLFSGGSLPEEEHVWLLNRWFPLQKPEEREQTRKRVWNAFIEGKGVTNGCRTNPSAFSDGHFWNLPCEATCHKDTKLLYLRSGGPGCLPRLKGNQRNAIENKDVI